MIIVKLSGGLGNQLFQYSFGRYLSLKYNTELKFDIQLNTNASDFTFRLLGLSKYNTHLLLAEIEEIKKYKFFINNFLSRIERKFIQLFPFFNKKFIIEKTFYILDEYSLANNCYYDGYWQSEIYFNSIRDIIQSDLRLIEDLSFENKEIADEIVKSNAISLHIRRGDYISVNSNTKIYAICTLEYYLKAIDYFNLINKNPVFFIFSDDTEWAKNNFKKSNFKIVDINRNSPEVDLYLMSLCKHNIIANSSYSWWGAWLNTNPSKIVISPSKWFNDEEINKKAIYSLIPNNWMII